MTEVFDAAIRDLREWQQLISSQMLSLHMIPDPRSPDFVGRIRSRRLSDITAAVLEATPHSLVRTAPVSEAGGEHIFNISLQLAGSSAIQQSARSATLDPGDFVMYDTWINYRREFPEPYGTFVLMLPASRLGLPADALESMTAVKVDGSTGIGAVVSKSLVGISENLGALRVSSGARTAQAIIDLVAASVIEAAEIDPSPRELRNRRMRASVRDYIDRHFTDRACTPESIAAAFFVSRRQLHAIFEDEGQTVAEILRARRFETARAYLRDPSRSWMTVADIADACGFGNPTSFARGFRAKYGISPSELRHAG